jgi:hypothetical protein
LTTPSSTGSLPQAYGTRCAHVRHVELGVVELNLSNLICRTSFVELDT